LRTSVPAIRSGNSLRTDSRTFSLWRNQSRAPRENRSYQRCAWANSDGLLRPCLVMPGLAAIPAPLFLRPQGGDVIQRLVRAVLARALIIDQPLLDRRDLLLGLGIRTGAGGDQAQHVAALFEQVLLDGLAQAGMLGQGELVAALIGAHGLAHDFLAERSLARIGDADLGFHIAQEALVGVPLLAGYRILDLAPVQHGLDFIEVFFQQQI